MNATPKPCWYGQSGAGHTFEHGADTCRRGNVRRSAKQAIVIDLDHLQSLMDEFISEQPPQHKLEMQLRFSAFLAWLERKQAKEATSDKTT
jgi:hypothetical protein